MTTRRPALVPEIDKEGFRADVEPLSADEKAFIHALAGQLRAEDQEEFVEAAREFLETSTLPELVDFWYDSFYAAPVGEGLYARVEDDFDYGAVGVGLSRVLPDRRGADKEARGQSANIVNVAYAGFRMLDIDNVCHVTQSVNDASFSKSFTERGEFIIHAQGILAKNNWEECTMPFVGIKINLQHLKHVIVAVYARKTHRLEVFDPSSNEISAAAGKAVAQVIALREELSAVPRVVVVNPDETMQEEETHGYCQAWMLWYMYMRFRARHSKTAGEITRMLLKMDDDERYDEIRKFSNMLYFLATG